MDAKSISSEDEGSIVPQQSKTQPSCGACRTRQSDVWWKAPKGLTTSILCDNCGNNWRKYADLNVRPVREESLVAAQTKAKSIERGEKREGTPLAPSHVKRVKVIQLLNSSSLQPNYIMLSEDPNIGADLLCSCFLPVDSTGSLSCGSSLSPSASMHRLLQEITRWKGSKMQAMQIPDSRWHVLRIWFPILILTLQIASCGAIVDPSDIDSWECELCHNEKTEEASLVSFFIETKQLVLNQYQNTDCLLCPRRRRDRGKKGLVLPPPDSFLRASKPTEGQGWAHVICAVFMPETSFTDEARLRVVEGISAIPVFRWQKVRKHFLLRNIKTANLETGMLHLQGTGWRDHTVL